MNVGLKDLRENIDKYEKLVNKGETVVVYRKSTPLFRLEPVDTQWEEVIDFTKLQKGGVDINDILSRI